MRRRGVTEWMLACALALGGCGDDAGPAPDAGAPADAGAADAASGEDAGAPDAGAPDAGPPPPCGDGVVGEGEHCDLGPDNGGEECAWDCTPAAPFNAYDAVIRDLMGRWEIPGGAVAVTVGGRLVLVRGYGAMDPEGTPMNPLARFRIASVSKPVTSAAVMLLVQEGRLSLDDLVFERLAHLVPEEGTPERAEVDPRIFDITVRHLLHHSGGWDRAVSYDPMFIPDTVSEALGVPSPPEAEDVARYMVRQPLDFTPGERYAYSNFGYSLLGRIIEQVTGVGYEEHVRAALLEPIGATGMEIGATRMDRVAADESHYFRTATSDTSRSVFDEDGNPLVPRPYGAFYVRSLDSHGGWIARTVDLLRFSGAVDGFEGLPDVLDADHLAELVARPESLWPESESPTYWYGMGWHVRVTSRARNNRWHTGALAGTATLLVRTGFDVTWVALFNRRPGEDAWWGEMDMAMWDAYRTVDGWPEYDLFDRYD